MAEIQTLLGRYGPDQINETNERLNAIYEQNPVDFMAALLETMKSEENPQIITRACLAASIRFPEMSKLPDDPAMNPINIFGDELAMAIIERCFELIGILSEDCKHIPAVLLGKVGVYFVHREFENNHIVERLSTILQEAQTVADVNATNTALKIILESYDPSEEEVQALVTAIFGHFTSTDNIQVSIAVLDIMVKMIENITELLEDPSFSETVVSVLMALLENEESYVPSLICLLKLGKLVPALLADLAAPLVLNACRVLNESTDESAQLYSCMMIRKIAKLELKDQTLDLGVIKEYGEVIFMCLMQTMSANEETDCVTADVWRPFVAAYQAMKYVLPSIIAPLNEKIVEEITKLIESETVGEIDAGLRILSIAVPLVTGENGEKDATFGIKFLEPLTAFVESEAPCIRQRALICIRKIINEMATSKLFKTDAEFKGNTVETAGQALEFLQLLDDVPPVVSEVISLMKVLTEIDGFTETEQIISTILERATQMNESFLKNPFYSFNEIIMEGPAEPAAAAFPTVISLYQEALGNEEYSWLAHELTETIQVYCYRPEFQEGVSESLEQLVPLFAQAIEAGGLYADDALIPLAALAKASHEKFVPYLESVITTYTSIFSEHLNEPGALYGALIGMDILLNEGFEVPDQESLAALCAQQLSNFDHEANVRTALMRVLATLARINIPVVLAVLEGILPFLKVYAKTLPVQQATGREESDLMAFYLTTILDQLYRNIEPAAAEENFEIAADVLRYYANFNPLLKSHLISAIKMSLTIANINPDFLLSQISIEEGIGNLFVDASNVQEASQIAKQLLSVLHYQ